MKPSVVVVDSDVAGHPAWLARLQPLAGRTQLFAGPDAATAALRGAGCDVLLVNLNLGAGAPALIAAALQHGRVGAALACGHGAELAAAVAAMRAGAADVVPLPCPAARLEQALREHAGLGHAAADGADGLVAWRRRFAADFVGDDPQTQALLALVRRVADTDADVLITGASGTGKELVARCIHAASRRARQPFVALNCAAIPRDLMESEIFGHARGAFTGATERRGGRFEAAAGGTLFLDEMGEMDLGLQSKFLRVVQEREVTPVGDSRSIRVDVRIISATNQDLTALCRERLFREDLFYRLNVVPVQLPELRERPADIEPLLHSFLRRANARHGRAVRGIAGPALEVLRRYTWPGNVRELQNLVERLVVLKAATGPIVEADLPASLRPTAAAPSLVADLQLPAGGVDINAMLNLVETRLTLDALRRAGNNRARAAELLGLKRTTLVERLKKLNIAAAAEA